MPARFTTNFDEFTAMLLSIPDELTAEADALVPGYAEAAAADVRAAYPTGATGELVAGVGTENRSTRGRVTVRVVSKAYYAKWYDLGNARQRPRPTFIPITRAKQTEMLHAVVAMVRAAGFSVTGDAGLSG